MADRALPAPPGDNPELVDALRGICVNHGVELVIPAIDPELVPLSRYADRCGATGSWVSISEPATVAVARAQLNTFGSWPAGSPPDDADAIVSGLDQVIAAELLA